MSYTILTRKPDESIRQMEIPSCGILCEMIGEGNASNFRCGVEVLVGLMQDGGALVVYPSDSLKALQMLEAKFPELLPKETSKT